MGYRVAVSIAFNLAVPSSKSTNFYRIAFAQNSKSTVRKNFFLQKKIHNFYTYMYM